MLRCVWVTRMRNVACLNERDTGRHTVWHDLPGMWSQGEHQVINNLLRLTLQTMKKRKKKLATDIYQDLGEDIGHFGRDVND